MPDFVQRPLDRAASPDNLAGDLDKHAATTMATAARKPVHHAGYHGCSSVSAWASAVNVKFPPERTIATFLPLRRSRSA